MKKLKSLTLLSLFLGSMLYSPGAFAKKKRITFAHVFDDGCVGTHTVILNSAGEVVDHEYEVFACP